MGVNMNNLNDEWQGVIKNFEAISSIPRCSGNEKEVSNYILEFANNHNCEVIQEESYNLIIRKKATPGYEKSPIVILQGHLDMVGVKDQGIIHDFSKDPIKLKLNSEYILAEGTSLGADNGIAIAYILTLIESKTIEHPPLEFLLTTGEEVGMTGASKIDAENFKGKILINLDSEEEGKLLVSGAGAVTNIVKIPIVWMKNTYKENMYALKISGLKGGHSGLDINKGRANAIKLLARLLHVLTLETDIKIAEISGGGKANAIPNEAKVIVCVKPEEKKYFEDLINIHRGIIKKENELTEPDLEITTEVINDDINNVISKNTLSKIISLLTDIPNGVQSMSKVIKDLVQSSTNVGIVSTSSNEFSVISCVRSSDRSLKSNIVEEISTIAKNFGGKVENEGDYPEWKYREESYIRGLCEKVHKKLFDKKPEIYALHVGIECGILKDRIGDLDMISIGPNIYDVHTTKEKLDIKSAERTWNFIKEVLKEIR
jgi:dipeptidase D